MIEIRLLGRFAVRKGGDEIPPPAFAGRLTRALIRVLLTRRGQFVSRDFLTEALWPRRPPADPSANLSVLVNRARRALQFPDLIISGPAGYAFAMEPSCVVDAEVFSERARAGHDHLSRGQPRTALRDFLKALEIWGGEPLAEDVYDDWSQEYRTQLWRLYADVLEEAASAALLAGDGHQAVRLAERAVAREPLRESSQLLLVRALAQSGDAAGALSAFDRFRHSYAEELGLDPSTEALQLQQQILRAEPVGTLEPARAPFVPHHDFDELPFVGRKAELQSILHAITTPSPGVILLQGKSGSGKSRLIHEVGARSPVPVVYGRSVPAEKAEPWSLVRSLIRAILEIDFSVARVVPERAAQAMADIIPELSDLRPDDVTILDPESRRAMAGEAAVAMFKSVSSKGLLLAADDLQWADPTSLSVMEKIMHRVDSISTLLAYRPEEIDPASQAASFLGEVTGHGAVEIDLAPLGFDDLTSLVADESICQAMAAETDGTPFSVAEVIRSLAASGALYWDEKDTRWHANDKEVVQIALEASKAGKRRAIRNRIERQTFDRRETLALLSLLKREASARLLAEARGVAQALVLPDLDALARTGLLRLGESGWGVAHDLISDIIDEGLTAEQRACFHAQLSRALDSEDVEPSELARHLAGAGDAAEAARQFAAAAHLSLDHFANDEAERLSNEGLELQPPSELKAKLLEIRGEARARSGNLIGARDDFRVTLSLASEPAHRSRVLSRLAMLVAGLETWEQAAELVALALVEACSDDHGRARALWAGAVVDTNLNRLDRAEVRVTEALSLFEKLGDGRGVADVLEIKANLVFLEGQVAEGVKLLKRAADVCRESGHLVRAARPLSNYGWLLVLMGRPLEALEPIEEALALERMLGNFEGEGWCLWQRCEALAQLGRAEEALKDAQSCFEMAHKLGNRQWIAGSYHGIAAALISSGETAEAEKASRKAVELGEGFPNVFCISAARLSSLLISRSQFDEAEKLLDRVFQRAPPGLLYEARLARAQLAAARGDPDATAVATETLRLAEAGGHLQSAAVLKRLLQGT